MLRSAGHGDEVVVVDCNFPAHEVASKTVTGKVIQLAGVDVVQACDAICSVCASARHHAADARPPACPWLRGKPLFPHQLASP